MRLNQYIDHTLLKPDASPNQVIQLCKEAITHEFYAVCVAGCYAEIAAQQLKGSKVKLAVTIGFPLGSSTKLAKVYEAKEAVSHQAHEIDMVLNIGLLKSGKLKEVEEEVYAVKKAIGDTILKVIIETCYLNNSQIEKACKLSESAGANFVKTSTGFGPGGATIEHVELMKSIVGDRLQVKASGGIRDRKTAEAFIRAGANRIGTSSGINIVTG